MRILFARFLTVVTVVSLCAFAALAIPYGFDLPFSAIIRLMIIVFGLAWLVIVRSVVSQWKGRNLQLLYFFLYVFMLAQFHRIRDDWGWLEVVANCLLGLAFLGSAAKNGLGKLTISGRDKAVVGCIVVGGVVGTASAPLVLGEISELITVDWRSRLGVFPYGVFCARP